MPINFASLFQDSWNFMRNQMQFTLFGIALLAIFPIIIFSLFPSAELNPQQLQSEQNLALLAQTMIPMIISSAISVFINILLIINIQAISNGSFQRFFNLTGMALKAFFPVLLLTLFMVMPVSFALSFSGIAIQSNNVGPLLLPLMVVGIFVFVKLSLVSYAYLIEKPQKSIFDTLKFTWQLSRGKMVSLLIFCMLTYLLPSFIGAAIAGVAGSILSQIASAVLNLFIVIFSVRFYQVYRQLPAK